MRYISDTGTGADPAARVNACLYQHVSEPSQKQLSKAFVQRSVRQHQRLSKRKKEKCCICSVHLRTKPKDPYRNSSVRIDVPLHHYFRFNKSKWELKSLHTESEIYVRNVFTLKINTTSRSVNHVYVLPPKFSFVIKKIRIGFDFFVCFTHPWQAFWQFRATVQANAKIQNGDCQVHPLHLAAQSTVKILAHQVHRNLSSSF